MKIPCNTHFLKILPKWFEDVESGKKKFEIRRNDRPFAVGDILVLQEYERGRYTGREIQKEIEYIYTGDGTYGLSDEFCILGIVEHAPTVDAIPIPEGATNGDMLKALFPNIDASVSGDGDVIDVYNLGIYCQTFDTEWWNSPYKAESEDKE